MFFLINFVLILILFIFGLSIGSFLNVVIFRLHKKEKLTGRSKCPKCNHELAWYDLIPLFSFLFLKGKCRYCHEKISVQYPIVEFATAFLFVLDFILRFYNVPLSGVDSKSIILFVRDLILFSSLVVIFVYDIRYMEIPDEVVIPTIVIVALFNFFAFNNLSNILLGGTVGAMFFLIQFISSKGKWIGGGDVRLGLLIGVLFGPFNAMIAIFISYLLGTIYSLPILFRKYILKESQINNEIWFGPFLVLGTITFLFFSKFL